MHTYTPVNNIFDGSLTKSAFNTVRFDRSFFHMLMRIGEKNLMIFKFGTVIGCFPSDRAAIRAVKGLNAHPHKRI